MLHFPSALCNAGYAPLTRHTFLWCRFPHAPMPPCPHAIFANTPTRTCAHARCNCKHHLHPI